VATKSKTKAKAKTAAKKLVTGSTGKEAVNLFSEVSSQVENLTEKAAFSEVEKLVSDIESNSFRLGGILAVIQDKGWVGDSDSFRSLVVDRFGIQYRKAMYLVSIYTNLVQKQIPWSTVKDLGWTKLKELAPILTSKNVDTWVKKAEKMTVLQLIEAVAKSKGGSSTETGPSTVTTLTFKLHKDQKKAVKEALDKGKKEFETEYDSVVLSNICSGYLGGTVVIEAEKKEPKELKKKEKEALFTELAKELGWKKSLEIIGEVYDKQVEITVDEKE
jgi:hypothetical protein